MSSSAISGMAVPADRYGAGLPEGGLVAATGGFTAGGLAGGLTGGLTGTLVDDIAGELVLSLAADGAAGSMPESAGSNGGLAVANSIGSFCPHLEHFPACASTSEIFCRHWAHLAMIETSGSSLLLDLSIQSV
jgi:hypothetical protein